MRSLRQPNDAYYGTNLATTAEPLILWYHLLSVKNCKLQVLSNECCFDFIGQSIDETNHY